MYEELIKNLRIHSSSCTGYPHYCDWCTEDERGCDVSLAGQSADAIEELEKAAPRWISVAERLPKKPEGYPKCGIRRVYYLVALKSGCVESLGYEFDRDEWQITGSPVVAWMPLPDPPKEE